MIFAQIASAAAQVKVDKNLNYAKCSDLDYSLNIYHKKEAKDQDVIIFVHGGSWSQGKKETYWWLGRNFAKKNVVTVNINYPLAPKVTYKEMALATAQSVKWVKENIASFGGNPQRIFLMGHSAGGHLVELINADPQYYKTIGIDNPVKGIILNDPFGLDMEEYLNIAEKDKYYVDFLRTFSTDQKIWRLGSPLAYTAQIKNPHLIFYGSKTYQAIQIQSERLHKILTANKIPVKLEVINNKKHVGMISQMIFGGNRLYKEILEFLRETK